MVYVGVDLHRKRSQVAVVNEAGEVLANRAVPSDGMEISSRRRSVGVGSPTCSRTPAWRRTCRTC